MLLTRRILSVTGFQILQEIIVSNFKVMVVLQLLSNLVM